MTTIYLIVIVLYVGIPPHAFKYVVPQGVPICLEMARAVLTDPPPSVLTGHAIKGWSATCSAEVNTRPS